MLLYLILKIMKEAINQEFIESSNTIDSTYFNIEFKKDDFEIKENPDDRKMIFPRQTYLYFPKNDNSKIAIYTKDGTMFEALPNRKQTLYDTQSITVENYSDWTDTEVEVLQAAVASCYYYESIKSKKYVDFKVLKVEDVNGNYYNINYSSKYIIGTKELIIDTDLDLPKFDTPYIPRSSSEFNKLLEKILSNIEIRDVEEIQEDYTYQTDTTTDNDGLLIFYIPFVKFLKYDTITDMTDSNGYKINFTWTSLPFDDKNINVITSIDYKNSMGEVIEVEYSYSHQDIDFPATPPVRYSGNKSVYLLESIVYRKSGEQDPLINAFNFEYNDQGFINKVKYPIRDESEGKGIIEYEYEPYKYITETIFAQLVHSDPLDSVGGGVIQDATYGVVTRIEEGDKVTRYSRGIFPGLVGNIIMGFPKQVYVIHPDNTYEKHNYIIEGYWVSSTTYINSWRAGHEESVEYYSAWESGDDKILQKVEYDWCARGYRIVKTSSGDIPYAAKNIRLERKTIKKYSQDDPDLFKTYEIEYSKYDDWGNITRMVNRRDIEDPTDDIFIVNYYLHDFDSNYWWKHIINKVRLTIVKDKDGNILKRTRFKYDQSIPENYGIDTEQKYEDVNLNPSKLGETYRGNLTTLITYIAQQDEEGLFSWDNVIEVKQHFTYDIFGNQVTLKDSKGNTSKVTYDETYNYALPVEAIDALNYKSEISYYQNTYLVKTSTDINGNNVSNEYDSLDRVITTIYPKTIGSSTTYEYHDDVFPAYTVVRNNIEGNTFAESVYYYDGMGRFIYGGVKEDIKNGIDSWVVNGVDYDHMGRKKYIFEPGKDKNVDLNNFIDPRPQRNPDGSYSGDVKYIRYEYDVLGRTKKVFIPDAVEGNTATLAIIYDYDDFENSVKITDAKGHSIKYYFNSQDKLEMVEELDENGNTYSKTRFKYDLMGNMTEMRTSKDGVNWMVSKYTYDSEGRLIKSVLPDSGESTFIYDLNGNLTQSTDAKGITIKYYYDKLNRQTKIEYPDGSYILYEYDNLSIPNGKGKLYLKRRYQPGEGFVSSNKFTDIDDMGRLLKKQEFINFEGHNPVQINHNYSYNKVGFMLSHDISVNGQEIQRMEYQYDLMGRADVLYETVMGQQTTKQVIAEINEFNALGMVEKIDYANDISVKYTYNEYRHWMEEMEIVSKGTSIFKNKYFYDVVGNRTKLKDENNIETTYDYDSLYRLTNVNGKYYKKGDNTSGSIYTYDQVGNRLMYESKYGKITYEYDKSSNRLLRVNFNRENDDLSYMLINYDANGNTIQRDYFRNKDEIFEQELYEYNYDNMMVHYVRHKPVMKNNRIEMEVESELNMKYDVNGMRVIKECYPNTNDSTIYIYEGGEVVLEMTYEQIPKYKHLFTYAGGKKVSRTSFQSDGTIDLDSRNYFHQNFLGSIAMITDKDGNIEEHNKYEPFGDIIWSKSYVDTDNDYKFTGKERDKESNLDYFNARYLDTKLGRFMKADTNYGKIQKPQTLNRFVYSLNNPLKYLDSLGFEEVSVRVIHGVRTTGLGSKCKKIRREWDLKKQTDFIQYEKANRFDWDSLLTDKPNILITTSEHSGIGTFIIQLFSIEEDKGIPFAGSTANEIWVDMKEFQEQVFKNPDLKILMVLGCTTSQEFYGGAQTKNFILLTTKHDVVNGVALDAFIAGIGKYFLGGKYSFKDAVLKAYLKYYANDKIKAKAKKSYNKKHNREEDEDLTEEEWLEAIEPFFDEQFFLLDSTLDGAPSYNQPFTEMFKTK
ncbi:RHS repeat-associated core domain-containing protein [Candidatus Dependentiae bacterium]|nr:RHS repeat-associated core domain-containing protein [Candidatus Dependentiae bacterium]